MAVPQLLWLGQDLYALGLVEKIPDTIERITFNRDLLIASNMVYECKNIDDFFSTGNSASMLNGTDWLYSDIEYINEDGITTWSGIVTNIRCNHREKKAYIETKDNLFSFRDKYISYTSSDWETAADAALNIMSQESYTAYDAKSFQDSANYLDSLSAYLKVKINIEDNVTLFQTLEQLGIFGGADVYSHLGQTYFKVWKPHTGGVSLTLNTNRDNRLKNAPIVNYLEPQMINDYDIDYDGSLGVPLTDSAGGNIGSVSRSKYGTRGLEPMNTGTGSMYTFKDSTTAQAIGEIYINRSHYALSTQPRPLVKIQFNLDIKFKQYITLGSKFKLNLTDENWTDKIFEVYEFRRGEDRQNINIVAYEVVA